MSRLFLYAALLLLTQCSKCKNDPKPAEEQLPPATQTGANTFGCLVNREAWTPKGRFGTLPDFYVSYDPSYAGGSIDIRAYRFLKSGDSRIQRITLGGGNVSSVGTYSLVVSETRGASYQDEFGSNSCQEYRSADPLVYCRGSLTVTRLDIAAGIVSGTFDFVLAKPGCDTIKVTQGRFDYKL